MRYSSRVDRCLTLRSRPRRRSCLLVDCDVAVDVVASMTTTTRRMLVLLSRFRDPLVLVWPLCVSPILKLQSHRTSLESKAIKSNISMTGLLLTSELNKAEMQPLLATLDNTTERSKHLN